MSDPFLVVRWDRERVGVLSRMDDGSLRFRYDQAASRAISRSLPLPRDESSATEHPATFFENLLPEGAERERLARALGVSTGNDAALLLAVGGDCAGALTLLKPGAAPVPQSSTKDLVPLTKKLLVSMRTSGVLPTLVSEGLRLSLAGAQEKVAVVVENGRLFLPVGSRPSTHILKFPSRNFPGLVENELFMMKLAESVGLRVPVTRTWPLPGGDVGLLVERFDRKDGQRLHQEDFCQASGVSATMKYEEEGGPSFEDIVAITDRESVKSRQDVERLFYWQAFNVLTGNNDAHAKNVALLRGDHVELAPSYDLVCTRAWPELSKTLALKVGGRKLAGDVDGRAWATEARRCGVAPSFVKDVLLSLRERTVAMAKDVSSRLMKEGYEKTPIRAALEQVDDHCRWAERHLKRDREWVAAEQKRARRPR